MSLHAIFRQSLDRLPVPVAFRLQAANAYLRKGWVRRALARRSALYRAAGSPTKVMSGPFNGMAYLCSGLYGNYLPNILGVYEKELHPSVEAVVAMKPDVVIDVGSAEGYYIVGLARRLPEARFIAFDLLKSARWLLAESAKQNGLEVGAGKKIEQREGCDPAALSAVLQGARKPVVICDCEGYEDVLLDMAKVPALKNATIIVEVHDGNAPKQRQEWVDEFPRGVTERLRERFGATHEIETITDVPRTGADKPVGCPMSDEQFVEAATELRVIKGYWLVMRPRG